jgi:outer membrane PBP1 activator LpoA protein
MPDPAILDNKGMSLHHARQLHQNGYHAQAAEEVQQLRANTRDEAGSVVLLAEIYLAQGYVNRAHSLLTVGGRNVMEDGEHAHWLLSMIRCFTGAILGEIWISIAEADRIYSEAAAFLTENPTTEYAVRSSFLMHF